MVRARILKINDVAAQDRPDLNERGRSFLEREQNLTWSARLPEDNQLLAGRWWSAQDAGKPLVSISSEYQETLHLQVGDRIGFDGVQKFTSFLRRQHRRFSMFD